MMLQPGAGTEGWGDVMETMDRLEKVELIRERTGLSYAAAHALLERAEGDVLQALIMFEQEEPSVEGESDSAAQAMLAGLRTVLQKGNATRIIVQKDGRTVAALPVSAGIVGALLSPQLALLAGAACILGQCRITVEREGEPPVELTAERQGEV